MNTTKVTNCTLSNAFKLALFVVISIIISVFANCLFPQVAFANEEAASGIGAMLPNMIEFIPMLIAFILLWIILAKFGWPMFAAMLDKREKTIKDALSASEEAKEESERVLEEYKKQLENARTESAQIIQNARKNAENLEIELKNQAQKSAEEIIDKAKTTIQAEKKAAISELQDSLADMSISIASKLIEQDLDDDTHRAIVKKYVEEAGSFNA